MAQPKINGARCIVHRDADGIMRAYSRHGLELEHLEHITAAWAADPLSARFALDAHSGG